MKKYILLKTLAAAVLFLELTFHPCQTRGQAFDFMYRDSLPAVSMANIPHSFSFYLYQNCYPAPVNFSNLPVRYNPGTGIPVITETLAGLPFIGLGNNFCVGQLNPCTANGPLTFQKAGLTYSFTQRMDLSIPGIYTVVTEFMPFGSSFGNFQAANIAGNFGLEPRIFQNIVQGFVNKGPEFIDPPVIFASVNQPVSFSAAAIDPDGDSLVYRLRPINTTATYAAGFTYLNPITASPSLALNARTGSITFTPTAYDAAAGPGATANKYVVGLDVDEYRRGSTGFTKIATIQRNILINVISTGNNSPVLTAFYQNSTILPNTIIDVPAGTSFIMDFLASDPDLADHVGPVSNATRVLPGATFAVILPQNPSSGRLYWSPTVADIRNEPYFFNVTAIDDACPYPASITHTFGIRVRNVAGQNGKIFARENFRAYPNPFSENVTFQFNLKTKTKSKTILIFNLLGQQIDEIELHGSAMGEEQVFWKNSGNFPKGTYLARLISEGKAVQTLKFVKQ